LLAAYALSAGPIDRLLVVPTYAHPFAKVLQPFELRVEMCERAFGILATAEVSRIEEELGTPSFTVRTLEALAFRMPGTAFRLVVGADVLADAARWKDWDRVCTLAPPYVVGRSGHPWPGGYAGIEVELPAVSSTEVRERLRTGRSVEGLLPRSVAELVQARGLYR